MAFPTKSLDLEASSSQYASISDASQTGLDITGDFCIEAWVNIESAPSSGEIYAIADKWSSTGAEISYALWYQNNAGTLRFVGRTSDGAGDNDALIVNQDLGTNTWVHVAMSFDASAATATFFVDGSSVGSSAGSVTTINNGNEPFTIGNTTDNSNFFDGKIGLTRVWSSERTATQLNDNKCTILGATTNLVAEWTFDDVYTDNSGNSNTLTPSGSPVFASDVTSMCVSAAPSRNALFAFGGM